MQRVKLLQKRYLSYCQIRKLDYEKIDGDLRLDSETASFEKHDWFLIIGTAGLWGASPLFIDIALDDFHPSLITWLRVLFGCLTICIFPSNSEAVRASDRRKVMLLGFTWMAFPLSMFPIAQQWVNSSMTGMLYSAVPILTVMIAAAFFQVSTSPQRLKGICIGLIGIVLISSPEISTDNTNAFGVGLMFLAFISYGIGFNLAGPLQSQYGSIPVVRRALTLATLLTTPLGIYGTLSSSFSLQAMSACLVLGAGGTGIAYIWSSKLAGRVGAVRSSIVAYLFPIEAAILGVMFRGDSISYFAIIGVVIAISGAYQTNSN